MPEMALMVKQQALQETPKSPRRYRSPIRPRPPVRPPLQGSTHLDGLGSVSQSIYARKTEYFAPFKNTSRGCHIAALTFESSSTQADRSTAPLKTGTIGSRCTVK